MDDAPQSRKTTQVSPLVRVCIFAHKSNTVYNAVTMKRTKEALAVPAVIGTGLALMGGLALSTIKSFHQGNEEYERRERILEKRFQEQMAEDGFPGSRFEPLFWGEGGTLVTAVAYLAVNSNCRLEVRANVTPDNSTISSYSFTMSDSGRVVPNIGWYGSETGGLTLSFRDRADMTDNHVLDVKACTGS